MSSLELPFIHILVIGFHHQKGGTVEYVHPPFSSVETDSSLTTQLPPEWRHLPHLALPDGCHNYEEDATFFVLPALESTMRSPAVYGIACCRQIDSSELKSLTTEVTRRTVQKSVCILSKLPLYGSVEAKLNQITQAYFEVKDFSDVSILKEALASINGSFQCLKIPPDMFHVGLSAQALVLKFGHRLLQIFKALLLQKRVIVCGSPTNVVCRVILSIFSLFPKAMEMYVRPEGMTKDEFGLPLQIITSPFAVKPYVCLQQMDTLAKDGYLLAGVSNPLFQKQYSKYCDVYVNLDDGLIDIGDPSLKAAVYLTAADLRFCDYLFSSVQDNVSLVPNWEPYRSSSTGWFGSNSWMWSQYRCYLLSLLSTSLSGLDKNISEFGTQFMESFMKSPVFVNWKLSAKYYAGLSKIEPVHLCQGNLTLKDLKLRLSAQATEYGISDKSKEVAEQVLSHTQHAISTVGGAMGGVWSAASSAVSSWWSGDQD